MKRRLTFIDDARGAYLFKRMYEGMLLGGGQGARGIDAIRREARILDALDAISDPEDTPRGPERTVKPDAVLELDQVDFAVLESHVAKAPWLPVAARQIVDLVDWLSAAEKVNT